MIRCLVFRSTHLIAPGLLLALSVLLVLSGCDWIPTQPGTQQEQAGQGEASEADPAAQRRKAAVDAEIARLEQERLANLAKVEQLKGDGPDTPKVEKSALEKHEDDLRSLGVDPERRTQTRRRPGAQPPIELPQLNVETSPRHQACMTKCDQALTLAETLGRAVRMHIRNVESRTGAGPSQANNARTAVLQRQVDMQREALKAIPIDNRLYCANPRCGRYPPTPASYRVTICTYCRQPLQQKDANQDRRAKAAEELRKAEAQLASAMGVAPGMSPEGVRLQLEKYYGFVDTLDLLTLNLKNLRAQAKDNDSIALLERELINRVETLETIRNSLPQQIIAVAAAAPSAPPVTQPVQQTTQTPQAPVAQAADPTPQPIEPVKPKKTYKLKDGRVLAIVSELTSGNDLIVKTVKGEIVSFSRDDIE